MLARCANRSSLDLIFYICTSLTDRNGQGRLAIKLDGPFVAGAQSPGAVPSRMQRHDNFLPGCPLTWFAQTIVTRVYLATLPRTGGLPNMDDNGLFAEQAPILCIVRTNRENPYALASSAAFQLQPETIAPQHASRVFHLMIRQSPFVPSHWGDLARYPPQPCVSGLGFGSEICFAALQVSLRALEVRPRVQDAATPHRWSR